MFRSVASWNFTGPDVHADPSEGDRVPWTVNVSGSARTRRTTRTSRSPLRSRRATGRHEAGSRRRALRLASYHWGVVEPPPEVQDHYELEIVEAERLRRGAGRLEFVRTQEIIRRHLAAAPLDILDVGGGAGAHAAWLADDGYAVHVVDPMPSHVEQAKRLGGPRRRITAEVGDARALRAKDQSADAVLLLGPLYHLTEQTDRIRALREPAASSDPAAWCSRRRSPGSRRCSTD